MYIDEVNSTRNIASVVQPLAFSADIVVPISHNNKISDNLPIPLFFFGREIVFREGFHSSFWPIGRIGSRIKGAVVVNINSFDRAYISHEALLPKVTVYGKAVCVVAIEIRRRYV